MSRELPTLPQSLINLIGEYGFARTDGASEIERIHRWELLIDGIKLYAGSYAEEAARLERERQEAIRHAGAMLSNCAFNLKQRTPGMMLTAEDISALRYSQEAWDAAIRARSQEGMSDN